MIFHYPVSIRPLSTDYPLTDFSGRAIMTKRPMKNLYFMFKRGKVYYAENNETGKQQSLRTKDRREAQKLLDALNDAIQLPQMNLALARAYISAQDPKMVTRTWAEVMELFCKRGKSPTRIRHQKAMRSKPFQFLKVKRLIETTAEDFLKVMEMGGNSTIMFLKCLHNDAMGLGWLPAPILARKLWPSPIKKRRRAITFEEHQAILKTENNRERRLYYELLWFTGASQTDAANLDAENIDWDARVISYHRKKLEGRGFPPACMSIGAGLEKVLRQLPSSGYLFPNLHPLPEKNRSTFFFKICRGAKIQGVTLHSYRYSWAERAKQAGIPLRFAQAALGHNSSVHEHYAKQAVVVCPAIDG